MWNHSEFDFLDFGVSDGGNILFINSIQPGLSSCGIDIDHAKVSLAKAKGLNAVVQDILQIPNREICSFVTMSHFLEHLDSVSMASLMIEKALNISKNFIFVRQPWFDSDGFLFSHGAKFFWSDWSGHQNRMSILDFYTILRDMQKKGLVEEFKIFGHDKISSTSDLSIIPLETPNNQHHYAEIAHGSKNSTVCISHPCYREVVVFASLGSSLSIMDKILCRLSSSKGGLDLLYSSKRRVHRNDPDLSAADQF